LDAKRACVDFELSENSLQNQIKWELVIWS